jgi:hypothetical protein
MLPKSTTTECGLHLQAVVSAATPEELSQWPMLRGDDYSLIGGYIVLYSYIDFNLRRIVEAIDEVGEMPFAQGNAGNLTITDVEKAIQAIPELNTGPNKIAFERIVELRGFRNLLAHFAIRRFPDDDAFLFVTKSLRDYKREFGRDPQPGEALTAITQVPQIRNAVKEVENLLAWLSWVTVQIESWKPRS